MKRFLNLFIIFFLLFSFSKVYASGLTLEDKISYDDSLVYDVVSTDDSYYLVSSNDGTTIYRYDFNNSLEVTKSFSDISNSALFYNDSFYLIGRDNGFVSIYLLDQNLRILNSNETTIPIGIDDDIKIYLNDDKLYFVFVNDNVLTSNIIYEVGNDLDVKENSLSSLAGELEDIFGSYYDVYFSDNLKDTIISSSSNKNYMVVAGYNSNGYFLRIVADEVKEISLEDKILDTMIVNNNVLLLLSNNDNLYIRILSKDGVKIEDIEIDAESSEASFKNVKGNIAVLVSGSKSLMLLFDCVSSIEVEDNKFGTIKTVSEASSADLVSLEVIANSGYVLKEVLVYDEYDNKIEVVDNSFTMPQGDVLVTAVYEESIYNPDTIDIIFFIVIGLSVSLIILYITVKKLKWLN